MREADIAQVSIRKYEGKEAFLITDPATGQVLGHAKQSDKTRKVMCPVTRQIFIGTDAEITAKKAECDAKFAPIKAQREAAAQQAKAQAEAARAAARNQR